MGVKYDELDKEDRLAIEKAIMKSMSAMNEQAVSNTIYS
jgi:hypothetical protein